MLLKFLTGTLPQPQLTTLEIWLAMMKNGVLDGRALSRPEESLIYDYISAGSTDIKNFTPQYQVRNASPVWRWIRLLLLFVLTAIVTHLGISAMSLPKRARQADGLSQVITLNDGTIGTIHKNSSLLYFEKCVGRHVALSGGDLIGQ
jgi:hypothetical protein